MADCRGCLWSSTIVHFLVLMFGAGAWIAVNGVWVELPILVDSAPEKWELPSHLTLIAQFGNLGPILVTLMQIFCPNRFNQNAMIYCIVSLGTVACLLLTFFWDTHVPINGEVLSFPLYCLWWVISFVDCTSSVTFLPFMTTFQTIFLTTYFIGEGLSGFLPSVFTLIQGVQHYECIRNGSNTTAHLIPPRYSADVFFVLLSIMMLACGVAFLLLNYLGVAKKFYAHPTTYTNGQKVEAVGSSDNVEMQDSNEDNRTNTVKVRGKPGENDEEEAATSTTALTSPAKNYLTRNDYLYMLGIIAFVNALSNGVLPAVSSYYSLPYGTMAYHLSATLGNMANPLACFIAVFLPMQSYFGLAIFTFFFTGFGTYLMYLAANSPCPILVHSDAGIALMVLGQILFVGSASYVKISIAQVFRERGSRRSLVWYGAVVQAGSFVGALLMFFIVNSYTFFQSSPPCHVCPF